MLISPGRIGRIGQPAGPTGRVSRLQSLLETLYGNGEQGAFFVPKPKVMGQQVLFQDAAGTTPVTSDGDPVGLMLDLSGNDNHATQETSGARPTYRTDGVYHWLKGDGVDDALVLEGTSAWTEFSPASSSGFYIGTTIKVPSEGFDVVIAKGVGADANSFQFAVGDENASVWWRLSGDSGSYAVEPALDTDVVFDLDWNGQSARGTFGGDVQEDVSYGVYTDTNHTISLFSRNSGTVQNSDIRLYGVVMVDSSLRSADLYVRVRQYLANLAGVVLDN